MVADFDLEISHLIRAGALATAADYLDAAGADDDVAAEIAYWLRYDRLMILPDSSR
jgi:hypothetical protein